MVVNPVMEAVVMIVLKDWIMKLLDLHVVIF